MRRRVLCSFSREGVLSQSLQRESVVADMWRFGKMTVRTGPPRHCLHKRRLTTAIALHHAELTTIHAAARRGFEPSLRIQNRVFVLACNQVTIHPFKYLLAHFRQLLVRAVEQLNQAVLFASIGAIQR